MENKNNRPTIFDVLPLVDQRSYTSVKILTMDDGIYVTARDVDMLTIFRVVKNDNLTLVPVQIEEYEILRDYFDPASNRLGDN